MSTPEPYQQRVIAEKVELDRKREALDAFTHGDHFRRMPLEEQQLMVAQLGLMHGYSAVLGMRIARWNIEPQ